LHESAHFKTDNKAINKLSTRRKKVKEKQRKMQKNVSDLCKKNHNDGLQLLARTCARGSSYTKLA